MIRLIAILAMLLFCYSADAQQYPSPTFSSVTVQKQTNLGNWTTATRPASPAVGAYGYNTTLGESEQWNGSAWVQLVPSNGGTLPSGLTIPSPVINGGDASGANVVTTWGSNPRTLAQHFAGCDAGGANCATFDVKEAGMSPSASAATNTTALQFAITTACANSGTSKGKVWIPAGDYPINTGIVVPGDCLGLTIAGDGMQATLLHVMGNGDFLDYTWPPGNSGDLYSGFGELKDLRIYADDNPTSGTLLKLDHNANMRISRIIVSGGFVNIEGLSVANQYWDAVGVSGTNTTAGTTGVWFHINRITQVSAPGASMGATTIPLADTTGIRLFQIPSGTGIPASDWVTSFVTNTSVTLASPLTGAMPPNTTITFQDDDNYHLFVENSEWGGESGLATGLLINNVDELHLTNDNIDLMTGDLMLVQSNLTGTNNLVRIECSNTNFRSAGHVAIRFAAFAGYSGPSGNDTFSGCSVDGSGQTSSTDGDGVRVDDTLMRDLVWIGGIINLSKNNSVSLHGGDRITFTGTHFIGSNQASGSYYPILIDGATKDVTLNAPKISNAGGPTVANNINISGTASNVLVTSYNFAGATSADVSDTSSNSATDIIRTGITDMAVSPDTALTALNVSMPQAVSGTNGAAINLLGQKGGGGGLAQNGGNINVTPGPATSGGLSGQVIVSGPTANRAYGSPAPTTGTTVTMLDGVNFEYMRPAGTLATLTVVLPACDSNHDGRRAGFSTTQAISALTVTAASGSVAGAPTSLTAGGIGSWMSFTCRAADTTWYPGAG